MERRTFLRRVGVGGGVALAVGGGVAAEQIGESVGSRRQRGRFDAVVAAKRGRGNAQIWWSAEPAGGDKVLSLTFDDGPTEMFTARVLDVLDDYRVPATFFVIGHELQRSRDLGDRIVESGHELANHTFDHAPAESLDRDGAFASVEMGADAVAEVTGSHPRWFRPVRGNVTGSILAAAAAVGHDVAIWSISRGAFVDGGLDANVASVAETIPARAHPGAVALLHDGVGGDRAQGDHRAGLVERREAEVLALPAVIEALLADGYRFATMDGLIPREPNPPTA